MQEQGRTNVLVAEDDFLVCEMVRGYLDDIGYRVVGEASTGAQVVEMMARLAGTPSQPDVILMDIEMPDMNGIEAARQILKSYPTPIVALTAYETRELIQEISNAGMGAYLVKPSNTHEIERAITISMARFEDMIALDRLCVELQTRNRELKDALGQIKTLRKFLPMCAHCKKIRDDQGQWHEVDVYIAQHTDSQFTHGLCPRCQRELYPPEDYPYLYPDDD